MVTESDHRILQELEQHRLLHVDGDATSDQVLLKAGLKRAKAIITTLNSDAKNLSVTLTAKQFLPKLTVIARAANESSVQKQSDLGKVKVVL